MAKKSFHVVPNPKGGWSVKKAGAEKASKTFSKKDDATGYAQGVSKRDGSELVIHGKDGRIQTKDSHGHDPYPPMDKDTHKK